MWNHYGKQKENCTIRDLEKHTMETHEHKQKQNILHYTLRAGGEVASETNTEDLATITGWGQYLIMEPIPRDRANTQEGTNTKEWPTDLSLGHR